MKNILIVDDIEKWRTFNSNAVRAVLGNDISIKTADSASDAYDKLLQSIDNPFDLILTDLQMEDNFAPKYAGEWLVEQILMLPQYKNTKVIMISASYNINYIAENLGVNHIPKSAAIKSITYFEETILRKIK